MSSRLLAVKLSRVVVVCWRRRWRRIPRPLPTSLFQFHLDKWKTRVRPPLLFSIRSCFFYSSRVWTYNWRMLFQPTSRVLKVAYTFVEVCHFLNTTFLFKNILYYRVWKLASNDTVYKEIEVITSTVKKKRISFLRHSITTPENWLSRKIIGKLWKSKRTIRWMTEMKEDMTELQITTENLRDKTDALKILHDKHIT